MHPMRDISFPSRRRLGGFTLIETLVVVALLVIVAGITAPGFSFLIGSMNAKSAAFDLVNDLTLARGEAIKRNATVTVQPINGTNWASGWQIVAGAEVLRTRPALPSGLSVGAPAQLQFLANGRVPDGTLAANLTWSISSTFSGVTPRCIVITPTGSARSKHGGTCP